MRTMTCKQLGGACDKEFRADTFTDMARQSEEHGREMFEQQDPDHLEAMKKMERLMQHPDEMNAWLEEKEQEFNELPDD